MAIIVTGNKVHDDALRAAEHARQVAQVAGASQVTVRAADIAYARSCLASCITNNKGAGAMLFQGMLKELGVNT